MESLTIVQRQSPWRNIGRQLKQSRFLIAMIIPAVAFYFIFCYIPMYGVLMDYLVHKQGFTCIRWFVNGNEPNYLGVKGSSKNYNNSFEKWAQGVKNVRAALDAKGLTSIGIVGGDTTGFDGTTTYWEGIGKGLTKEVADYGAHLYLSNYYIDGGYVLENINTLNKDIHALDAGYGTERPLDIWESGLLDGKDAETDGNKLIKTVTYGIRMADFTIQTALAGVNSVTYWDFDDGMNFMEPTLPYETEGYYNGCVFPTGNVVKDGTLYVYYGAADHFIGLATCSIDELVEGLWKEDRV